VNCLQIIPEVPKFIPMTFEQIKSKNSLNQLSVVGVKKTSFGTFHQNRFGWKEDSNGSWLIPSKNENESIDIVHYYAASDKACVYLRKGSIGRITTVRNPKLLGGN